MLLYFHHFAAPLPSNTSLPLPIFALSGLPSSLPVFLPCLLHSEARCGQPPPEGRSPCALEARLPRLQAPRSVTSLPTHFQRGPRSVCPGSASLLLSPTCMQTYLLLWAITD